jgi:hypothetical protein
MQTVSRIEGSKRLFNGGQRLRALVTLKFCHHPRCWPHAGLKLHGFGQRISHL